MLYNLVQEKSFGKVMRKNIENVIMYLFDKEQHFGILCKIEHISFDPPLPPEITDDFRSMTLFFLAGYTFESAKIIGNTLVFEAGFGVHNIGSVVTVPLLAIMQIVIDDTPVLINLATQSSEEKEVDLDISDDGIKNSMSSFLSNPENQKFLKK